VQETLLFLIGVIAVNVPTWVTPGICGAVVGATATIIVGFSAMGWVTAAAAERMGWDRADSAVVAALVPFCVANAEQDLDRTKLPNLKAEQSPSSRNQLVSDSGWATMPGMTSPNLRLLSACSDKLRGPDA
jgi:hypothetical protein